MSAQLADRPDGVNTDTAEPRDSAGTARDRRRALTGGITGYFVDQFDIYVPVIALAPAMAYFVPEDLDAGTATIIGAFIFTATLIGRPIGAVIFGLLADRTGRRRATIIAMIGIAITTLAIAFVPGHSDIGLGAVALLLLLRLLDGVFLGGEYTAAIPLAMEWSPKQRRGLASGLITMSAPVALALISLMTLGLLQIFPAGSADSAYAVWGWRIPFVVGALLAAITLYRFIKYVPESEGGQEGTPPEKKVSPLKELFLGSQRGALLQVFLFMTGVWLVLNVTVSVVPGLTSAAGGLTASQLTVALAIASIVSAISYPLIGIASQRYGRRPIYLFVGVLVAVVDGVTGAVLARSTGLGYGAAIALLSVAFTVGILAFGPIAAYMTERFPAALCATGYGVGYSLALLIPAFYAYYRIGLEHIVGVALAPAALVVIGGVLITVGACFGPETRDVDMTK